MYRTIACGLVVLSLLAMAGCKKETSGGGSSGDSSGSSAVVSAKTPMEATVNFVQAIHDQNRAQFFASLDYTDEDKPTLTAMFNMMSAMMTYKKEMEKAYGKDAVTDPNVSKGIPTVEDVKAKVKITENGDKATGTMGADDDKPMSFVRKNGAWKMLPDLPPKDQRAKVVKLSDATIKAIDSVRPKIGKSKKEDVEKAFSDAMNAAMMELMKSAKPE